MKKLQADKDFAADRDANPRPWLEDLCTGKGNGVGRRRVQRSQSCASTAGRFAHLYEPCCGHRGLSCLLMQPFLMSPLCDLTLISCVCACAAWTGYVWSPAVLCGWCPVPWGLCTSPSAVTSGPGAYPVPPWSQGGEWPDGLLCITFPVCAQCGVFLPR